MLGYSSVFICQRKHWMSYTIPLDPPSLYSSYWVFYYFRPNFGVFVSFWKWQVISQYVFTICIKLSKEATIGLCHGTVSIRFLSTSSYAERVVNAKEFNEEFYNETFDIIIHCSAQFTNLRWTPFSDFFSLCCSH